MAQLISNIFSKDELEALKSYIKLLEIGPRDESRSRAFIALDGHPELTEHMSKIHAMARHIFKSQTLKPTYTLYCIYEGKHSSLNMHKDDNACTYTIDFCLDQTIPWGLIVEQEEYILQENEALAFMGNDQEHGRPGFAGDDDDHVAMIFFHYAEPDHWYFTEGPEYLNVIRQTGQQ